MFADLLLVIGKVVAAIAIGAVVICTLIPRTKFFKKHGRFYLESDESRE